jgi:hypothetical protein
MKWTIAENTGGQEQGFNNAGVETFTGNFDRYLARELIQNSLDARHDYNKPVIMKFQTETYQRTDIPDIDALAATFVRCGDYWSHDKKAREFFAKAEGFAKADAVPALRISDYNTTGVLGGDEEREKNWFNLIRCAGSSSKGGGEGGSFGIGKNAPFAASKMRSVLYSTLNTDNEHIFQGVSILVTHKLSNGAKAQNIGFLGGNNGASIRNKNDIPDRFVRNEKGTDIIVLGFPPEDKWEYDLVSSVLENFWPAIHFGDLEVTVGATVITKANVANLLQTYSETGGEEFSAHRYYKAFTEPTHSFSETLPSLREVSLYVFAGDKDLPNRVAMIRKTGMLIFLKPYRALMRYAGVFLCRNDTGNRLLRDMEPPRHDVWDPNHPEKGANKKTEAEYTIFIRGCMRKLAPVDDTKELNIPDLNRFLPDDADTTEESFTEEGEPSKVETTDRTPAAKAIETKKLDPVRTAMTKDNNKPGEGAEETEDANDDIVDVTIRKKTGVKSKTKKPAQKGGTKTKGNEGGTNPKPAIPVRYRTYATNLTAGVYAVNVAAIDHTDEEVELAIEAIGDDQKLPTEIKTATLQDGTLLNVKPGGVVGPLNLPETGSVLIEIKLSEPARVAMEVAESHDYDWESIAEVGMGLQTGEAKQG